MLKSPKPLHGGKGKLLAFGDSPTKNLCWGCSNLIYLRNKPMLQAWVCNFNVQRLIWGQLSWALIDYYAEKDTSIWRNTLYELYNICKLNCQVEIPLLVADKFNQLAFAGVRSLVCLESKRHLSSFQSLLFKLKVRKSVALGCFCIAQRPGS